MKKFVISLLSSIVMTPAMAHHGAPHHRGTNHHYYHQHNRDWVAPAIIITGAIVASEVARQNRELVRQEQILREHDRLNGIPQRPVIIERPIYIDRPVIIDRNNQTNCTEWREIVDSQGRVYRERICTTN